MEWEPVFTEHATLIQYRCPAGDWQGEAVRPEAPADPSFFEEARRHLYEAHAGRIPERHYAR